MSLSIGLEALNRRSGSTRQSFEAAYANFLESYTVLQDEIQEGGRLFHLLENVTSINRTVKQWGFTKSLESLIGHQLGSTTGSVEANAKEVSRTLWEKIVDWFKKIIRHIRDFFAKLFKTRRGLMLKLKEVADSKNSYKSKDTNGFQGVPVAKISNVNFNSDQIPNTDTETIMLTNVSSIRNYAKVLGGVLQAADNAERMMNAMLKEGLRIAERGVNKPQEDIDEAREMKNKANVLSEEVTKIIKRIVTSAKNFLKSIKKG